jgi:membrane-bound ClpP family serine protease
MFFDIRTIIGALIGLYGLILLITGAINDSKADLAPSGGWNTNLWSGIPMVVLGVAFLVWALLRPTRMTHTDESPSAGE